MYGTSKDLSICGPVVSLIVMFFPVLKDLDLDLSVIKPDVCDTIDLYIVSFTR